MPGYFALLRGINVGGKSVMKMGALRRAFEEMGFSNVSTFIASGNVYFASKTRGSRGLQQKIDKGLKRSFGRPITTFIRTTTEMKRAAAYNPYSAGEMKNADVNIVFLAVRASPPMSRRLKEISTRTDTFRTRGREVYWLRSKLPGRPDYASVPLDKALQAAFTVRGRRTIQKMVSRYAEAGKTRGARAGAPD